MKKNSNSFSRVVFEDIDDFPMGILLGEVSEVLKRLQIIINEVKKREEYDGYFFIPDGVDPQILAYPVSFYGEVPVTSIESSKAQIIASLTQRQSATDVDTCDGAKMIKIIGYKTLTKEEIESKPQIKEEKEALEKRELALYKRLKEKYGEK
ncbi:MAG: hypothetical protein ACOCV1_03995 [Bacillota bacterium]